MTQGWQLVWGAEWGRQAGHPSVEREGGGWLATRLGSGMGEAGWPTRLWSEKGEAGWSEDPSVEQEGRG